MTIRDDFYKLRPPSGFRVLLADPPWSFDTYSVKGEGKSPSQHYSCMCVDEIEEMPIHLLCAKDCALFLWCTWPLMPIWARFIRMWGFNYAGLAWEWIKFNPETGKYAFGPGYGTRKNLEPCLLATRGEPSLRESLEFFGARGEQQSSRSVRDFIEAMPVETLRAPRREHSRKPDQQYERIEQMFDGPYIELFARQQRPGWSAWGLETSKFPVSA